MEWTLTPEQKKRWQDRWSGLAHGAHVAIAGDLVDVEVLSRGKRAKKSFETWKGDLSHFFSGKPQALGRVLGDDNVAAVVAKRLGLADANALRAEHDRVRGVVRDGPLDVRLPGFEDLGPVPARELYFLLPAGGSSSITSGGGTPISLSPPSLEAFLEACAEGPEIRSIVVEGGSGLGKSILLKAARDVLQAAGRRVGLRPADDVDILIIDDWDQRSPALREATRAWMGPGRVAITSRREALREPNLPATHHALVELSELQPHWVEGYLQHVAPLIEQRWGMTLDLARLVAWMEDDPLAYRLISNHRILGLVLRAATRGDYPPYAPGSETRLLRQHLVAVTRDETARTFLQVTGEDLVADLAAELLRSCGSSMPLSRAAEVASQRAAAFGAQVTLGASGSIGLLTVLCGSAPFRASGQTLCCDAMPLVLPALSRQWRDHLPRLVMNPEAQEVLVAAACRDGDAVLSALLSLEPALLCLALPVLTRVLAAPARFVDGPLWVSAFRMCAAWWAHGPENPAAPGPGVARPATERFGGYSPLTLLALAAVRHQQLLRGDLPRLDPQSDLPEGLRAWLAVFEVEPPSEQSLAAALAYVAPMKAPGFPAVAELRTSSDWKESEVHGLGNTDWGLWWRCCAVPLWKAHGDGDRYIAGTAEGASVIPGCYQVSERALRVWTTAMDARVAAGDEGAPEAIAQALVFALTSGGGRLQRVLQQASSGWLRVRRKVRPLLAPALQTLKPRSSWDSAYVWTDAGSLFTRILVDFASEETVEGLWGAWREANFDDLPWRSFLKAGIPGAEIVGWALARGKAGLAPRRGGDEPTQRLAALEELEHSGDVSALVRMFAGSIPRPMRTRLHPRIRALGAQGAVGERIAAALGASSVDAVLLDDLLPGPEHREAWFSLVAQTRFVGERLARIAQWCAGQPEEGRWALLLETLDEEERRLEGAEGDQRLLMERQMFETNGGSWLAGQLAREDLPGSEDRHDVLRKLLSSPLWAPAMTDWSQRGLWALAARVLPPDEFRGLLVNDLRSPFGHDSRPVKLRSLILGGRFDMVVGLLDDPDLGPAAATALSGLNYGDKQWPLARLQLVLGDSGLRADGVVERLLLLAVRHDPASAVEWLSQKLEQTPEQAAAWWGRVLPHVPRSEARLEALRAWFAVSWDVPAHCGVPDTPSPDDTTTPL